MHYIVYSLFRSCFNPILAMDNHRFYSEVLHGNDIFQVICYFVCLTSTVVVFLHKYVITVKRTTRQMKLSVSLCCSLPIIFSYP